MTLFRTLALLAMSAGMGQGANAVYVAQSSAGGNTGADCADAKAVSYFNSSGNWSGSPTGIQIGPGTTVQLCGAFTGSAGSVLLTTQGAGASGNPVIIHFQSGASLKAPYWGTNDGTNPTGGAITIQNNYVTVDGGTACGPSTSCTSGSGSATGLIQNTANGTSGSSACPGGSCSNQALTAGVVINGALTGIEVKNLAIKSLYMHTACSSDAGVDSYGVFIVQASGGTVSNILVHDNFMQDANGGFSGGYSDWSNVSVYNNAMSRMNIEIGMGDRGSSCTISGLNIYGNELYDNYVWWDTGDANHLNGMHPFAVHSGSTITGLSIYNNYIHGDFGNQNCGSTGHQTADIFLEGAGGGGISGNVFNNVIVANGTGDYPSTAFIGAYPSASGATMGVYNNTIIGNTLGGDAIADGSSGTAIVENNLITTVDAWEAQTTALTLTSNYNVLYNANAQFEYGSMASTPTNLATWRGFGFDTNSVTGNPGVSSSSYSTPAANGNYSYPAYALGGGSSATGNGVNLTGLGITALNSDASGNARPSSGAWTIGAYNAAASGSDVLLNGVIGLGVSIQ